MKKPDLKAVEKSPGFTGIESAPQEQCGISVVGDRQRGVVRMHFERPISWVEFDSMAIAGLIKALSEKLAEIQI